MTVTQNTQLRRVWQDTTDNLFWHLIRAGVFDTIHAMATVFERIRKRELPAKVFYEDDDVMVIADHRPQDTVHLLIIPHDVYPDFYRTPPEVMSKLLTTARMIADRLQIAGNFRLVINNGYRQEIDHIHIHFLSSRGAEHLTWLDR